MSIFKKMWNGEIYPAENCVPKTAEYKQAAHELSEASVALKNALTEEQKELHYSYQNANAITATLLQQEIFKQSFKLGVQFQRELDDKDCLPDNE